MILALLTSVEPTPSVSANSRVRISSEIGSNPSLRRHWLIRTRIRVSNITGSVPSQTSGSDRVYRELKKGPPMNW
jgi:hypothetical protein